MADERSGLHWAVSSGDEAAVRFSLEHGNENVNLKDNKGCTPLLLAECIKDEDSYESIVRILVENGADVNVCNNTPLYSAVFYQKQHLVELLLRAGADVRQNNLLHIAAEKGSEGILGLLLGDKRCTEDVINGRDRNGRTPAFVAAQHDREGCLKMLIAKGADLSRANFNKETVMEIIFENMTRPVQFMMDALDSSVVLEKINEKNRYYVDFKVLAPTKCSRQMDVISSLLVAANDEEKTEVLQHPLIELYLTLKWSRVCYFFYLWIVAYVVFVLSMSIYVTFLTHDYYRIDGAMMASRCILIVSASCLIAHAVLQCCLTHGNHFRKYELWLNLGCTSLSLIVAIAENPAENATIMHVADSTWVLHIASIAILMSWAELMLLIGRLPTYGYYALMFSAVLQNVIRVLMAFLCLVVGFALSFSIQFSSCSDFRDPWRALVKTTVMMMGEFEYGDLFADKVVGPAGATSRVIFLMFIILTSIVLMNLMVGLAVSDIQCLCRVSHARKLEKQADFLSQLEKVLTSKKFRGKYVPEIVKKVLKRNCIDTRYELDVSTKFRRSKKLSSKLIDSLVGIAKSHRGKNDQEG
ncbi:transient receptor potential channel pyrexia-like [Zophobas morio]|uniref:transient receptor potential channel pyrexia-like n=1 Tax=Zophobas morio TaxID=2755281 RepID=UPI003082D32C